MVQLKPKSKSREPLTPEEKNKVEGLLGDPETRAMFAAARPGASDEELREVAEDFVRDVTERNAAATGSAAD
ncbi:hypothetical protein ACFY1J_05445 [Streptomyces sp. NPDC001406]|uniref:hypothetical protein n=1 Tax=Streptomyces sp. NPDC001406 TaxID=3364572 RepID=UPI00369A0A2A